MVTQFMFCLSITFDILTLNLSIFLYVHDANTTREQLSMYKRVVGLFVLVNMASAFPVLYIFLFKNTRRRFLSGYFV